VPLYALSAESIDALATTGITVHFEPQKSPKYTRTEDGLNSDPYQHPHFLCLYRDQEPLLWLDEEQDVRVYLDLSPDELRLLLAAQLVPERQYVLSDTHGNRL